MTAAAEVIAALTARGWKLGVAESLTGGLLAATLVEVPGASAVLAGGVVAYATEVKHTLLGVDQLLLAERGPVCPEVAVQMADGVRDAVRLQGRRAEVGISTTGIAGPVSPDGQPVGTVHVGVVIPGLRRSIPFSFDGDRTAIRNLAVSAAVEQLWHAVKE